MSKRAWRQWAAAQRRGLNERRAYPLWERVVAAGLLVLIIVALVKGCGGL